MDNRNSAQAQLTNTGDHRYRQAMKLARTGRSMLRRGGDSLTRDLAAVYRDRGLPTAGPRSNDTRHDADLMRAVAIHDGCAELRWRIEAYLFTTLTFDEVAARVQESPQVIELYAKCFCEVPRGLTDQQVCELVSTLQSSTTAGSDRGCHWKEIAANGGAAALDAIFASDEGVAHDGASSAVAEVQAMIARNIVEALRNNKLRGAADIRESRLLLSELNAIQPDESETALAEAIDQFLTSLQFWVGGCDRQGRPIAQDAYAQSAVELNLDETMVHGFGKELLHGKELLELQFPKNVDDPMPSAMPFQPVSEQPVAVQPVEQEGLATTTTVAAHPKKPPSWEDLQRGVQLRKAAESAKNQQVSTEKGEQTPAG